MSKTEKLQKGYIEGGYKFFFLEDQKEMNFEYHYHNFHKCLIVLEGKIKYEVEGIEYNLSSGDIIWVPSFDAHRVHVSDELPYKRVVVYLSRTFTKLLSEQLDQSIHDMGRHTSHHVRLNKQDQARLSKVFNYSETIDEHTKEMIDKPLSLMTNFIPWMNTYFEMINNQTQELIMAPNIKVKQQWIIDATLYIKENFKEDLTIDDIAKHVFLSKYYFMRKFKEVLGISIHQYLVQQRLIHARYLMKQGANLTEISYQSGFKDYSTFARAFKKTYKMAPRVFQKLDPTLDFE